MNTKVEAVEKEIKHTKMTIRYLDDQFDYFYDKHLRLEKELYAQKILRFCKTGK